MMDGWINGWMAGWMAGQMAGWMDDWMDGWMKLFFWRLRTLNCQKKNELISQKNQLNLVPFADNFEL